MSVLSNTGIRAGASGAGVGGYQVEKSLRFDGPDGAKLTRTFASGGDRKKWTYSYWIKRCGDNGAHWYNSFFWAGASLSGNLRFDDPATLEQMYGILASGVTMNTTRSFRDYSAWMHVTIVWDSNNGTAGDRFRLYIDGVRETSFTSISAISTGLDSAFNGNEIHGIGMFNTNTGLNCYLADVYFIDGEAKAPGDFAETDETTGKWIPKKYVGAYGTTGFHLKFDGTDLGEDSSGNDNDWTAAGFTQSYTTISSPNLPSWDQADTNWTKSNSDKNGKYTGVSSYAHIVSSALTDDTTYHFFLQKDDGSTVGGWFFGDTQSPTNTHPDEIGGNTLGLRNGDTGIGTYGTYATANSTSSAQNQITGMDSITDGRIDVEFVVNRTANKVWCRAAGDTTWIKGGDPTNASSTATFLIPDTGTIYFGYVGYDGPMIANFASSVGSPRDFDVTSDSPSIPFDDGGNGGGNYVTFNSLASNGVLSQGNLYITGLSEGNGMSSIGFTSGKWYAEVKFRNIAGGSRHPALGFSERDDKITSWSHIYPTMAMAYNSGGPNTGSMSMHPGDGSSTSYSSNHFDATQTFQMALDMDNGKGYIGDGTTWYNSTWNTSGSAGNPATGANPTFTLDTSKTYFFWVYANGGVSPTMDAHANFGQHTFDHTPPTGFKACNTYNLSDPTITDPSKHFNSVLYTGTGSSGNAVTGVGFEPDLVWCHRRDTTAAPHMFNSLSGETKTLYAGYTDPEDPFSDFSFDSDGFTADGSAGGFNASSATYVSWNWDANTSGSNDASSTSIGTIDSTYKVNTDAGFSIVNYTGNNTSGASVAHGLNAVPGMIIVKNRDSAGNDWIVYHKSLGASKWLPHNTAAAMTSDTTAWNGTTPTSTVWTMGNKAQMNNTDDFTAFVWSEVEGYSKFGTYEGNGSADGPFCYCGFRPAWIMLRNVDDGGNWVILDNKRIGFNEKNYALFYPVDASEYSSAADADILSNGFKLLTTLGWRNASAKTHIFAAFAESPFKYANSR